MKIFTYLLLLIIPTAILSFIYLDLTLSFIILLLLVLLIKKISNSILYPINFFTENYADIANGEMNDLIPDSKVLEISNFINSIYKMDQINNSRLSDFYDTELQFKAILNNIGSIIITTNNQGEVSYINIDGQIFLNADYRDIKNIPIERLIRNSNFHQFLDKFKNKDLHSDNILIKDNTFHIKASNITENDIIKRKIFMLTNITEREKLKAVRTDFVSNVSHELKTPITTIKGFSETLLKDYDDLSKAESLQFLKIINKQSTRIDQIVNELLFLSKIENNSTDEDLEYVDIDIRLLIESIVNELSGKHLKEINVDYNLSKSTINSNKTLLLIIFNNLIENSIKYNNNKIVSLQFSLDIFDGKTQIQLADNGIGIDESKIDRIFERFYQVDGSRSKLEKIGTGLGLSIVKHVVKVLGGDISVDSQLNKGTTFTIIL